MGNCSNQILSQMSMSSLVEVGPPSPDHWLAPSLFRPLGQVHLYCISSYTDGSSFSSVWMLSWHLFHCFKRDAFLRSKVNKAGVDIFMALNLNQESFLIPSKRRKKLCAWSSVMAFFIILNTEKLGPTNRQGLVLSTTTSKYDAILQC